MLSIAAFLIVLATLLRPLALQRA